MDYLERLHAITLQAQKSDDLPDTLAQRIFAIIAGVRQKGGLVRDIEDLAGQVQLYDTYAQTGYIGMGVDNHILDASLKRIEAKLTER